MPVAEGMVVRTKSERLDRIRRGVMELYVSYYRVDSLDRAKYPDVDLLETAEAVGLEEVRYGFDGARHRNPGIDDSNPYFTFDPAKCIVCSRCVRACEEVQGTFALTVSGRGSISSSLPGWTRSLSNPNVSPAAPARGVPDRPAAREESHRTRQAGIWSALTTCAYSAGVGCLFKAEMRGDEVVRMVPYKDGKANRGHSCVKGRFAWGYANHRERILKPMMRDKISDPWREVSWQEAIDRVASEFKRIQAQYGRGSIGGITSSRCTDEETFLVQKLVRATFGNNNTDTCARVCHSPTGYGLRQHSGHQQAHRTSTPSTVPTRDHHRRQSDRCAPSLCLAAEKTLAGGRELSSSTRGGSISSAAARGGGLPPADEAGHQCRDPQALAHVTVTEGLENERFVRERCDWDEFSAGRSSSPSRVTARSVATISGVPAEGPRRGAPLRYRRQRGDLLRPRRHRAQPGLDRGHGNRESRHGDRQYRPAGRRRESAARAEQRARLLRHGLVPA